MKGSEGSDRRTTCINMVDAWWLQELASQIVQTVLNDPKVLDQASQFLQRVSMLSYWV